MTVTLLCEDRTTAATSARIDGDLLWLSADDLARATGWKVEPRGLCRGDACVQIQAGWTNDAGEIDFTAFARHMGQPVVHDAAGENWAVGESTDTRRAALQTGEAPDFSLPDLDGKMHALSDFRGKKVFLYSWGSY